jgi:PAS domain S-box-containing protein
VALQSLHFRSESLPKYDPRASVAHRSVLLLGRCLLLAVIYYLMVVVGLRLRLSTSTLALLWPSNALLTATLVLSQRRHWWLYLIAVIPAHFAGLRHFHVGFWWIAYQVVSNSALAAACAVILRRFRPEVLHFAKLREVLVFITVSIVVTGGVSMIAIYPIVTLTPLNILVAHGWSKDFGAIWAGRWITNTASLIAFVPTILVCIAGSSEWRRNFLSRRVAEAVLLAASLITLTFLVYGHVWMKSETQPAVYLIPLPILLWAAVRLGPAGACLSVTAFVCVSSWCAYLGEGPFLRSFSVDRVTVLQACWMLVSVPVLCLAAVVQEQKAATLASVENEEKFRSLFTESPIGIALASLDGTILFVNPALCSMLGHVEQEMIGKNRSELLVTKNEEREPAQFQAVQAGTIRHYQREGQVRRKDGALMWGRFSVSTLRSSGQRKFVLVTVEDITEKRAALEDLKRTHQELQQLTPQLISAQEEERRRISRELHDDIGQRLALLRIEMDMFGQKLPEQESGRVEFQRLLGELDELVVDVHNMSHQLHSSKLELLGLGEALTEICRQVASQCHIAINVNADPLIQRLPKDVSLCLYRVAQEALTNAVKHSKSLRVDVSLTSAEGVLQMRVKDYGVGFDPSVRGSGLGLVTMQERLRMIGGVLRFHSFPGEGTEIKAEVSIEHAGQSIKIA